MIKINMQMPEKCGLCPCFHFENPMYCQAVKADKNKKIVNPYGSPRPEWCPLKEQEHSETFIVIDNKTGEEADTYNIAINALMKEQKEIEPMKVTYLYTELQDKLVQMMVEYLCEDHTEKELMELVEKAIKYSDGEKISS